MAVSEPSFDHAYPVVVEDGRRLAIAWNKTDDLDGVAKRFALEHGIMEAEVPTIQAFLSQATTMVIADARQADTWPDEEVVGKPGNNVNEVLTQVQEMGFCVGDGDVVRDLLEVHGGSVEEVLEAFANA
jgi:hypothetical protein